MKEKSAVVLPNGLTCWSFCFGQNSVFNCQAAAALARYLDSTIFFFRVLSDLNLKRISDFFKSVFTMFLYTR